VVKEIKRCIERGGNAEEGREEGGREGGRMCVIE